MWQMRHFGLQLGAHDSRGLMAPPHCPAPLPPPQLGAWRGGGPETGYCMQPTTTRIRASRQSTGRRVLPGQRPFLSGFQLPAPCTPCAGAGRWAQRVASPPGPCSRCAHRGPQQAYRLHHAPWCGSASGVGGGRSLQDGIQPAARACHIAMALLKPALLTPCSCSCSCRPPPLPRSPSTTGGASGRQSAQSALCPKQRVWG